MSTRKSNTTRTHLQVVPAKPLRLALTSTEWQGIETKAYKLIDKICEADPDHALALVQLMDLLTSEDYDSRDQNILAYSAIRHAFMQSHEGCAAIEDTLKRLKRGVGFKEAQSA